MTVTTLLVLALVGATPKFQSYTSKADGFSIDFPGTPLIENEKDGDSTTGTYTVAIPGVGAYLVSVTSDKDLAEVAKLGQLDEAFKSFRDGHKGEDGKIANEKKITGPMEGREYKIVRADMDELTRVFIAGSRLYALMIVVPHDTRVEAAASKRFFESFQLGIAKDTTSGDSPERKIDSLPDVPANGVFATVDNVSVTDAASGKSHDLKLKFTTDVKANPGSASIVVRSTCRVGKKDVKGTNTVAIGADKKGKQIPMEAALARLPGAPSRCELQFVWSAGKTEQAVDTECWPGPGSDAYPGPCDAP